MNEILAVARAVVHHDALKQATSISQLTRGLLGRLERPILVRHEWNRERARSRSRPEGTKISMAAVSPGTVGRPERHQARQPPPEPITRESALPSRVRTPANRRLAQESDFGAGRERSEGDSEAQGDGARRRDTDGGDAASIDGVPDETGPSKRRSTASWNVADEAHL